MSYSIKGKIHQISPDKQVTEKYKTREFVLFVENEKNPEYSDYITLQFSQAYCDLLDKFEIGHDVEVKFNASRIILKPASDCTGVIAGGATRPVVELAGIKDILTKSLGSNNASNVVRATIKALSMIKS